MLLYVYIVAFSCVCCSKRGAYELVSCLNIGACGAFSVQAFVCAVRF